MNSEMSNEELQRKGAKLKESNDRMYAKMVRIAELANECVLKTIHGEYKPGQYGQDYREFGKTMCEIRELVGPCLSERFAQRAKPKKIADRFKTAKEATAAHEKERVLMVVVWAQLKWLFMEDIEGESRLDYLKRCRTEGILKSDGYKELKRLEKAAKEGGAK